MIPLTRYRELFAVRGLATTMLASIPGRMPIGIAGLAILIYVQQASGSFGQAGVASAFYVLGLGIVAPFVGRVIDRIGPRQMLALCSASYPAALAALVFLVRHEASAVAIGAASFAAGATLPPVTICVRALFPRVLDTPAQLQTAYSIDSALVETVFIMGPALVAACAAAGEIEAAVWAAAAFGAIGGLVFRRTPAVRDWQVHEDAGRPVAGPLSHLPLVGVFATTICYSIAFGLFEVAITAFSTEQQRPAAAGIILAFTSLGSAAGALVYGSRHWNPALSRQFLGALLAMAFGMLLLVPVSNFALMALLSIATGAPMATVIAVQSQIVSRLSPPAMLAESFTWSATCLLCGISAGIAVGGFLAERYVSTWLLAAAAAMTLVGALIVPVLKSARVADRPGS